MTRRASAAWAAYREPQGNGPAFCGNMTMTPPPWAGRWQRVTGGWFREAAPQPAEPKPEPQGPPPQADPPAPTTDEDHRRVRHAPGPPRKRSETSRRARNDP